MKRFVPIFAALLAVAAVQANAQTMIEDTDGNGTWSMEEMMAAYPDLTEALFGEIDTNADDAIDGDELAAARDAGLIAS